MSNNIVPFDIFQKDIESMPKVQPYREWSLKDYGAFFGKKFKEALLSGSSVFIPKNGVLDLKGAYDMRTNRLHRGISQLMLRERQNSLRSPTGAFVSYESLLKAQRAGYNCSIVKGERGFDIRIKDTVNDSIKWFNLSQINNPDNLKRYFLLNMEKNTKDRLAYFEKYSPGRTYSNPAALDMEKPNSKFLKCSVDPLSPDVSSEYLGQVFAAMNTNTKLLIEPAIVSSFIDKTIALLDSEYKPGKRDILAIYKLASAANLRSRQIEQALKVRKRKVYISRGY